MTAERLHTLWWTLLLVALGLNLRPILTSISPLIGEIRVATGMGFQSASLLTVLPVVCMGVVALLTARLEAKIGEGKGISLGLLAIALACLARLFIEQAGWLVASAILAGVGVALIQALVPGVVKRQFQHRVPVAMGIYSAALMGGGGIAALLSPWVSDYFEQWQAGLSVWLLPAVLALILWEVTAKRVEPIAAISQPARGFLRNRRAWLLALYFGLINGGYTSVVAWLPAYYVQLGNEPQQGGSLLAIMTVFQVTAALLMPVLAQRQSDRRPLLTISLLTQLVGFSGLIWLPLALPGLWVGLIGFGLGACFALSLILTLDHLKNPRQAGQLAAFVQGIGFIITGLSPWVSGWLREITGDFLAAWIMLVAVVLVMMVVTRRFSPASYTGIHSSGGRRDIPHHQPLEHTP